ncbi:MAG: DNA-processing protein DprA [Pseudomonadota bacterium]
MIESDLDISIAALALQRSSMLKVAPLRDMLLRLRYSVIRDVDVEKVIEFAGFDMQSVTTDVGEATRDIERGLELGINPIPISSERYPAILRGILDAPPIIYIRGSISAFKALPGVAVVGTRKASAHGLAIASRISEFLSNEGRSVVSGLALGIDAAAHEGALLGATPTIAVLAHGLENAQPVTNRYLAQRILENGGLWVSEHAVGVPAKPANFVLRNRIQVGLSCASIIVEGEAQSGSKTQAEYCLRSKRALFAVLPEPGSRVATVSELPRMLVNVRGATPIYSKRDYPAMMAMIERSSAMLEGSAYRSQ